MARKLKKSYGYNHIALLLYYFASPSDTDLRGFVSSVLSADSLVFVFVVSVVSSITGKDTTTGKGVSSTAGTSEVIDCVVTSSKLL